MKGDGLRPTPRIEAGFPHEFGYRPLSEHVGPFLRKRQEGVPEHLPAPREDRLNHGLKELGILRDRIGGMENEADYGRVDFWLGTKGARWKGQEARCSG